MYSRKDRWSSLQCHTMWNQMSPQDVFENLQVVKEGSNIPQQELEILLRSMRTRGTVVNTAGTTADTDWYFWYWLEGYNSQ